MAFPLNFKKIPPGRAYEAVVIGQQIRHTRRMKDISQKTLAERVKVNLSFIGRVERGVDMPNLKLLIKIAKALQVATRELIPQEL
jgi:transcriptional regulator with XRE-family HTH domain